MSLTFAKGAGRRNLARNLVRHGHKMGWLQRAVRFGMFCLMWTIAFGWIYFG